MTWLLRRANTEDLDAVMAIETTTFPSDAWSRPLMRAELAGEHGYYLVALADEGRGPIEGYGGLLAPWRSEQADIQTIAVVESARGQGLGRTLMQALLVEARRRGAREVFLEVRADNPGAEHLYETLGFERIGVRPHYYQPDGVDAHVMRLAVPEPETAPA